MNLKQFIRKTMDSLCVYESEKDSSICIRVPKKKVGEWKEEILESSNGKFFYFPTNEVLKDYDPDKQIMFNPIGEEKRGNDTESYKLLCRLVGNNIRTYITATSLSVMGSVTKCDKVTDKKMSKFVSRVTEIVRENGKKIDHVITEETLTKYKRLLNKSREDGRYPVLLLSSKRQFEKSGSVYNRGVSIKFPLYNHLKETLKAEVGSYTLFGIEISKYQLQLYIAVLELVCNGAKDGNIDFVSNDKNFPSYVSLMHAYREMMTPMMKIFKDISKKLTEAVPLNYNLEFLSEDELSDMANLVEEVELVPSETPSRRRSDDTEPIMKKANRDNEPIQAVSKRSNDYPYGKPTGVARRDDRSGNDDAEDRLLSIITGGRGAGYGNNYSQPVVDSEMRHYDSYRRPQQQVTFGSSASVTANNPFNLDF